MKVWDSFELITLGLMIQKEQRIEESGKQAIMRVCQPYFDSPKLSYLLDYIDCKASNNHQLMQSMTWTGLHEACIEQGYQCGEQATYENLEACPQRLSFLTQAPEKTTVETITIQSKPFQWPVLPLFIGACFVAMPYIIAWFY